MNSISISLDNKFIVSGSYDQTIKVWEREIGMPIIFLLLIFTKKISIKVFAKVNLLSSLLYHLLMQLFFNPKMET